MVLRPGCRLYVPPGGLLVDSSRPREFPVTVEASLGPICYGARTSGRGHWGKDTARRRSLEGRDRASRGPRDTPLRSPRSSPLPDVRSTRYSQLRGQSREPRADFASRGCGARRRAFCGRRSVISAAKGCRVRCHTPRTAPRPIVTPRLRPADTLVPSPNHEQPGGIVTAKY